MTCKNFHSFDDIVGSTLIAAISARIQADPISISLSTGVNVTLDCLVQNGVPADSIHWFKNGQPISISEDPSSKLHERARVVLRNITQADAGKYECKIVKGEEFDTDVYYLNVKGDLIYLRGNASNLRCRAILWLSFYLKKKIPLLRN